MSMLRALAASFTLCALAAAQARAQNDTPNDKMLGLQAPEGSVILFDGSLEGWQHRDGKEASWPVTGPIFTVGAGKGDIRTQAEFGNYKLHLEFACPYEPNDKGQARGNSGVYIGGIHEVQVLDSYGLKSQTNDCAAVYQQHAPRVNACKPPLQWQSYDITYTKARVKDGKVVKKARVTVVQNGVNVLDNKEIDPTPGGIGLEAGKNGPLLLQDHGDAVQYRNIWLIPVPDEDEE